MCKHVFQEKMITSRRTSLLCGFLNHRLKLCPFPNAGPEIQVEFDGYWTLGTAYEGDHPRQAAREQREIR